MPPEASESGVLVIPQPSDGSIELTADCWGWAGGQLSQISSFTETLTSSDWDSGTLNIGNERCGLSVIVNTSGDGYEYSTFTNGNPSVPAPFNVREIRIGTEDSAHPYWQYAWRWQRGIGWQWKGDISKITGFTINLNGKAIATVPANQRSWVVTLPEWCGTANSWTVTANAKSGTSPTSAPGNGSLPTCPVYIMFGLEYLEMYTTCEGLCFKGTWPCDTLDAYWTLAVGSIVRRYYGGNIYYGMRCGFHNIEAMNNVTNSSVFLFPISPTEARSWRILAEWWDYDTWSGNDLIFRLDKTFGIKNLPWAEQAVLSCSGSTAQGTTSPVTTTSARHSILSDHPEIDAACGFASSLHKTDSGKGFIYVWWAVYKVSASGN
jgi:hypothetical protein